MLGIRYFFQVSGQLQLHLILEEFGDETSTESEASTGEADQTPDVDPLPWIVSTRYGRHAGHWNLFQLK